MTWDSNCLAEIKHSFNPNISSLMLRNILSEDDVTYSTINDFFRLNKIQTLAVSYPGSQSDTPLLTEPNKDEVIRNTIPNNQTVCPMVAISASGG